LKFVGMLSLGLVALFATSIVRADDTKVSMGGGTGHSPTCGSNTASANNLGVLTADCLVKSKEDGGTGQVTSFSFEVADSNTRNGGLTCVSDLSAHLGWTLTTKQVGGIDICTLTAPESFDKNNRSEGSIADYLDDLGDPHVKPNDKDCDPDDFVLGIPVGCDINIDSVPGPNGLFAPNAPVGFGPGPLPSLPEPGTLALLMVGLTGLPFVRRKLAR
jgi:hypothetical protein